MAESYHRFVVLFTLFSFAFAEAPLSFSRSPDHSSDNLLLPPAVCGVAQEVLSNGLAIHCPFGSVVEKVNFASYGSIPAGQCGSYIASLACSVPVTKNISALCIGNASCVYPLNETTLRFDGFGSDPCSYVSPKTLVVEVQCSLVFINTVTPFISSIQQPVLAGKQLVVTPRASLCATFLPLTWSFEASLPMIVAVNVTLLSTGPCLFNFDLSGSAAADFTYSSVGSFFAFGCLRLMLSTQDSVALLEGSSTNVTVTFPRPPQNDETINIVDDCWSGSVTRASSTVTVAGGMRSSQTELTAATLQLARTTRIFAWADTTSGPAISAILALMIRPVPQFDVWIKRFSRTTVCAEATGYVLTVACSDANAAISSIVFASFGTPSGSCGSYTVGGCHQYRSRQIIESKCLGKNRCVVPLLKPFIGASPCTGIKPYMFVEAVCLENAAFFVYKSDEVLLSMNYYDADSVFNVSITSSNCAVFSPPMCSLTHLTTCTTMMTLTTLGQCTTSFLLASLSQHDTTGGAPLNISMQTNLPLHLSLPSNTSTSAGSFVRYVGQSLFVTVAVEVPAALQLANISVELTYFGTAGSLTILNSTQTIAPRSNATTYEMSVTGESPPAKLTAAVTGAGGPAVAVKNISLLLQAGPAMRVTKMSGRIARVCGTSASALTLTCPTPGQLIDRVNFASFGWGITGQCGNFAASELCPASITQSSALKKLCVGHSSCYVITDNISGTCEQQVTRVGWSLVVDVLCAEPPISTFFTNVTELFEFWVDAPVAQDTTLHVAATSSPASCASFEPSTWSFSQFVSSVAVNITAHTIGSPCALSLAFSGTALTYFTAPTAVFDVSIVPRVPLLFSFSSLALYDAWRAPGLYHLEVGKNLSLDIHLQIESAAQRTDVVVALYYLGTPGSVEMPASVVIPAGFNKTTVQVRGAAVSVEATFFATVTTPTLTYDSFENATLVIWGAVPVWSLRADDNHTYARTSDRPTKDILLSQGFTEICNPLPYQGAQHFCVTNNSSAAAAAYPKERDISPFYVLSPNFPSSLLAAESQAHLVKLYTCVWSPNNWDRSQYITTDPRCGDGSGRSTVVGYGSKQRSSQFSAPLRQCLIALPLGIHYYNVHDDGVCADQFDSEALVLFVIPVVDARSLCSTFWCPQSATCLISNDRVCDGVKDCGGNSSADEDTAMCCAASGGYYCAADSVCLPNSKLCDGIVDCPLSGGVDESPHKCFTWPMIDRDATLSPAAAAATGMVFDAPCIAFSLLVGKGTAESSLTQCIQQAIGRGSTLIGLADNNSHCVVFKQLDAQAFFRASAFRLTSSSGFRLYGNIRPLAQGTDMMNCQSGYSCSGSGELAPGTCQCICHERFYGAACEKQLDATKWQITLLSGFIQYSPTFMIPYVLNGMLQVASSSLRLIAGNAASSVMFAATSSFDMFDGSGIASVVTLVGATASEEAALFNHALNSTLLSSLRSTASYPLAIEENARGADTFRAAIITSGPLLHLYAPFCSTSERFQLDCALQPSSSAGNDISKIVFVTVYILDKTPDYAVDVFTADSAVIPLSFACHRQHTPQDYWKNNKWCEASTCMIDVSNVSSPISRIKTRFPNDDLDCFQWVGQPQLVPALRLGESMAGTTVKNTFEDFTGFLVGGVLILVVSLASFVVSMVLIVKDLGNLKSIVTELLFVPRLLNDEQEKEASKQAKPTSSGETSQQQQGSKVLELLTSAIGSMKFYLHEANITRKTMSYGLLVTSINLAAAGVLLILFYSTSNEYDSSHEVLIEKYYTNDTNASLFSPLPYFMVRLGSTTSRVCVQREVLGVVSRPLFIAGYCTTMGTAGAEELTVAIRSAPSQSSCEALPFSFFKSGSQMAASRLFADEPTMPVVQVSCGTKSTVRDRAAQFNAMRAGETGTNPAGGGVFAQTPRPELRQHWDNRNALSPLRSGQYQYVRVLDQVAGRTSSSNPCRFETAATAQLGNSSSSSSIATWSLIAQLPDSIDTLIAPNLTFLAQLQQQQHSGPPNAWGSNLPAHLIPADKDLPVGFDYKVATGASVGPGASRYYGVRGSYADIGYFFGPGKRESDGEGVTISLYLALSQRTEGFAFAVTDAFEDLETRSSPLLSLAKDMVARHSSGSAWFPASLNIYCGLLVDGPGSKLHLIWANSIKDTQGGDAQEAMGGKKQQQQPFVDLVWDLEQLGLTRLFNGAWHLVNFYVRSENAQTKAQLIVDGETSRSRKGWNQCVPRRPLPIEFVTPSAKIHGLAPQPAQQFLTAGLLYAGYLNEGSVGKLEFLPMVKDLFEIWIDSTAAIRQHNHLSTDKYVALGSLLLLVGVVFFGVMWVTSGREILAARQEALAVKKEKSIKIFAKLWARGPCDATGARFHPIPWSVAKAWLGLNNDEIFVFLEELTVSFHGNERDGRTAEQELVRLLYIFSGSDVCDVSTTLSRSLPTAEEWNGSAVPKALEQQRELITLEKEEDRVESSRPSRRREEGPLTTINLLPSSRLGSSPAQEQEDQTITEGGGDEESAAAAQARDGGDVNIDAGKLHFAGTQQVATQDGDVGVGNSLKDSLKQLLLPVLTVLQSVGVWMSTAAIPQAYHTTFGPFFSALSADVTAMAENVPEIVTPLLQLFVGVLFVSALYFYLHKDELLFAAYIGRYTLRRDELENGPAGPAAKAMRDDPSLSLPPCNTFHVQCFNVGEAAKIDDIMSRGTAEDTKSTQGASEAEAAVARKTTVTAANCNFTVEALVSEDDKTLAAHITNCAEGCKVCSLEDLGCRCIQHKDRRLHSQFQTDVWPFDNRPECCVVVDGIRCSTSIGKMYVCAASDDALERGAQCGYAVCQRHLRGTALDLVLADLLHTPRSTQQFGKPWLFVTVALFLCNACYTPFLKTALMILGCHPYFQCMFPNCWSPIERDFVLAIFLSLFVVVFFGIGFPTVLAILLRRRSLSIQTAFFAEEYNGRFGRGPSDTRSVGEWFRFSSTDPTALSELYKSFELSWIYVPPLLCAWKVILLIPPVLLETNSYEQTVGIAVVEFSYGLFLFVTEPSIAPMVDLLYKVGATHQMIFLGLQSLDTHYRYHNQGNLSTAMVGLTLAYLALCVVCMIWGKIAPGVQASQREKRISAFLKKIGMRSSGSTSVLIVPHTSRMTTCSPLDGKLQDASKAPPQLPRGAAPAVDTTPDVKFPGVEGDNDEVLPFDPPSVTQRVASTPLSPKGGADGDGVQDLAAADVSVDISPRH